MKTYLDCYPCFVRQALEAARMAGADETQQRAVLNHVLDALRRLDLSGTPPEVGDKIHRLVREMIGSNDPYQAVKERSTREALALYPRLKALAGEGSDPLDRAVRLAIAGNIIDLGPAGEYDLWANIERVMAQPFAIDDSPAFHSALIGAKWVLYLADNAGETVFDRVLIETLDRPIVYAAKGGPTLNDATVDDALAAGLDKVAEIVSTGSDAPGTILDRCTDDFRRQYDEAGMIIAKGQANYETLSTERKGIFFLLQTKCPVIARDVGVPTGSIVLKRGVLEGGDARCQALTELALEGWAR
jgi:uncharacterized protein with ATP-grasp and redox domains